MFSRLYFLIVLLTSVPFASFAQIPMMQDFTIIGDTYKTLDGCYRLTEEVDYSSGSIWYKYPVDLSEPFKIQLSIRVGCKDESGADGMVFVFTKRMNQLGYVGEGIGFAGLVPSVGIEIDTWRNYHLNDPAEDHIAIMANGRVGHRSDLAGPNKIVNIEDCYRHSLVIIWRPESQKLSVEIDTQEVIAATGDIARNIFGGQNKVYWGVTAATGRYNNLHEVCFDSLVKGEKEQIIPFRVGEGSFAMGNK